MSFLQKSFSVQWICFTSLMLLFAPITFSPTSHLQIKKIFSERKESHIGKIIFHSGNSSHLEFFSRDNLTKMYTNSPVLKFSATKSHWNQKRFLSSKCWQTDRDSFWKSGDSLSAIVFQRKLCKISSNIHGAWKLKKGHRVEKVTNFVVHSPLKHSQGQHLRSKLSWSYFIIFLPGGQTTAIVHKNNQASNFFTSLLKKARSSVEAPVVSRAMRPLV